jgi:16S rRNA pseudouridine516 synthase
VVKPASGTVRLDELLFTQGFGSRRECAGRIAAGQVSVAGEVITDPRREFETAGLVFEVEGRAWPWHLPALLVMNKPAGHEVSTRPSTHPSVFSLLPAPLRRRGVQAVGRLDQDTTGLLLFTDDGALLHRLTSPRHHLPKVYEVTTRHPVEPALVERLLHGVVLHDDPAPVRAADCSATGPHGLRLVLTEGRYHQVKRMVAAAGNRVEALHRSAFGALVLPADLAPGQWRWLDSQELVLGPG